MYTLEHWAFIAEIAGGIGVIASLIYLATQLRQTTRQLQNQAENVSYERVFQAYDPIYEGRNAEIFYTGLKSPEALEDVDAFVFDMLMHRQFGAMAQIARQIDSNALPPAAAKHFSVHYRKIYLETAGGRNWFERNQEMFEHQLQSMGLDDGLSA